MYREGDIIQIMDERLVVLGISKETDYSSLSHIIYVFYRDEKNLYDKVLNPKELISLSPDYLNIMRSMNVVGHKKKKELEVWIMKNKMLNPKLRGLMPVENVVKVLKKELDNNKYKKAANKIKKKSTFKKITRVKPNQIVAAKLERGYRIFLVEDTRTIEFIEPDLSMTTNLVNIDFIYMDRVEEPLAQANEYYLLGGIK